MEDERDLSSLASSNLTTLSNAYFNLCMLYVSRPVLNQKSVMVLSTYAKQRIIMLHGQGYRSPIITKLLKQEGPRASRVAVYKFLRKYQATSTIRLREGSGRPSKITRGIWRLVNERMEKDDETTATQLHQMLIEHGTLVLLQTILRYRSALGWMFCGSAYCQLMTSCKQGEKTCLGVRI